MPDAFKQIDLTYGPGRGRIKRVDNDATSTTTTTRYVGGKFISAYRNLRPALVRLG